MSFLFIWDVPHMCSVTKLCLTLCDPMDCSPPGSSVHGFPRQELLEQVAISYSRGSSQPKDWTHVSGISCIGRWILYHCGTWEALHIIYTSNYYSSINRYLHSSLFPVSSYYNNTTINILMKASGHTPPLRNHVTKVVPRNLLQLSQLLPIFCWMQLEFISWHGASLGEREVTLWLRIQFDVETLPSAWADWFPSPTITSYLPIFSHALKLSPQSSMCALGPFPGFAKMSDSPHVPDS